MKIYRGSDAVYAQVAGLWYRLDVPDWDAWFAQDNLYERVVESANSIGAADDLVGVDSRIAGCQFIASGCKQVSAINGFMEEDTGDHSDDAEIDEAQWEVGQEAGLSVAAGDVIDECLHFSFCEHGEQLGIHLFVEVCFSYLLVIGEVSCDSPVGQQATEGDNERLHL